VAIKACVDGFLVGCRPYLGVDSTHLTGKYNGQLAAATAIDGHNWMYPVAYGIFYKETKADWGWFLTQLKRAIGIPQGLTIHTDACKGLETAVHKVFGEAVEHRECFRHLMHNFRKHFEGDVLRYMWPCAWACTIRRHQWLWDRITENCPEAIPYLQSEHKQIWSRAKFSGPKLERAAGRPRVKRIKARGEPGKRGQYQCKRCLQFGHIEKGCFEPPTELGVELPPSFAGKSKKKKERLELQSSLLLKSPRRVQPKRVEPKRVQHQAHLLTLIILRKDVLSPLLNLMLNYHLHFLPNLSQLKLPSILLL